MTTTYQEVLQQIAQLKSEAESLRQAAIIETKERIKSLMDGHGLTWAEVGAPADTRARETGEHGRAARSNKSSNRSKATKDGRSVVKPKYRDPKSGETWSGRGKTPRWMAAELKKGKSREQFAIVR